MLFRFSELKHPCSSLMSLIYHILGSIQLIRMHLRVVLARWKSLSTRLLPCQMPLHAPRSLSLSHTQNTTNKDMSYLPAGLPCLMRGRCIVLHPKLAVKNFPLFASCYRTYARLVCKLAPAYKLTLLPYSRFLLSPLWCKVSINSKCTRCSIPLLCFILPSKFFNSRSNDDSTAAFYSLHKFAPGDTCSHALTDGYTFHIHM